MFASAPQPAKRPTENNWYCRDDKTHRTSLFAEFLRYGLITPPDHGDVGVPGKPGVPSTFVVHVMGWKSDFGLLGWDVGVPGKPDFGFLGWDHGDPAYPA